MAAVAVLGKLGEGAGAARQIARHALGARDDEIFHIAPASAGYVPQPRVLGAPLSPESVASLRDRASYGLVLLSEEISSDHCVVIARGFKLYSCVVHANELPVALFCQPHDVDALLEALSTHREPSLSSLAAAMGTDLCRLHVPLHAPANSASSPVIRVSCHARVGLMGNPSDNFHGKTVSFLLENFCATVTLTPRPDQHIRLQDPCVFDGWQSLCAHSEVLGYSSGLRLLQATCAVFFRRCQATANEEVRGRLHGASGFDLTYRTDIPRMVGMSGSSAIVVATLKALLRHFGLTAASLGLRKEDVPELALSVERDELGISAGLQDRVVQTYGGMVAMDFRPEVPLEHRYTELDPGLLPPLYLLYNTHAGGESGKVHSTVKERWAARDPALVAQVQRVVANADVALAALAARDFCALARCVDTNFALRREVYGDAVVGVQNVAIAQMCADAGLAAKFTGSGGAFVCLRKDGQGWFAEAQEQQLRAMFAAQGFAMERIRVPVQDQTHNPW